MADDKEQEHLASAQTCSPCRRLHQSRPEVGRQLRAALLQPCAAPSGDYGPSSPEHLTKQLALVHNHRYSAAEWAASVRSPSTLC